MVDEEITYLQSQWTSAEDDPDQILIGRYVSGEVDQIDPFDVAQLAAVIRTCQQSKSLSAAGRNLFAASRANKTSRNDADRLRKYLDKFGLSWDQIAL